MTMSDSLNNRQIKYNLNLKQLVIINNQFKKKNVDDNWESSVKGRFENQTKPNVS